MGLGLAGHDLFGRFAQQLANGNLSLVPPSHSFVPPPALFYPLPQPPPAGGGGIPARPYIKSGGGTHSTPEGESERASDPVGGGVAAILAAPLHDAVLFFRIAPCNTLSSPPPILT